MGPVDTVFVHHSVTSAAQEIKEACRALEAHARALGHRAIDYSFVCHQDGQRAVGRGWRVQGGHTLNWNAKSYGICGLGDFRTDRATDALIDGYADTIREGIDAGAITPNPAVRPHSDVFATACPATLKAAIPEIKARITAGKGPGDQEDEMFVSTTVISGVVESWLVDGGIPCHRFTGTPGSYGVPGDALAFVANEKVPFAPLTVAELADAKKRIVPATGPVTVTAEIDYVKMAEAVRAGVEKASDT